MKYEVYIQNSEDGKMFDITSLCGSITYDSYLEGQPGKLTCLLQKDPNKILKVSKGSKIMLKVDGVGMFYGFVFIEGTDATGTNKITAYDQLRYLKNNIIIETSNQTASQIFETVCKRLELNHEVKNNSSFICSKQQHIKKSAYSVIEYGLNQTLINVKKINFIRDDYGTIIFDELTAQKTSHVIGDKSLLTGYQYETSIDKDTFNRVIAYKIDKETGKYETWNVFDSSNEKKWGRLQTLIEAKKDMNPAQITEMINTLLRGKSRITKTLKLNAIGIKELKAGSGFVLNIEKLGIMEYMWINSITHIFSNNIHFMQMEVFAL